MNSEPVKSVAKYSPRDTRTLAWNHRSISLELDDSKWEQICISLVLERAQSWNTDWHAQMTSTDAVDPLQRIRLIDRVLTDQLNDDAPELRQLAIELMHIAINTIGLTRYADALGDSGRAVLIKRLCAILQEDVDFRVRLAAVDAITPMVEECSVDLILCKLPKQARGLRDENDDVGTACIRLIGNIASIAPSKAIPVLREALKSSGCQNGQLQACRELAQLHVDATEAASDLWAVVTEKTTTDAVRIAALRALAAILTEATFVRDFEMNCERRIDYLLDDKDFKELRQAIHLQRQANGTENVRYTRPANQLPSEHNRPTVTVSLDENIIVLKSDDNNLRLDKVESAIFLAFCENIGERAPDKLVPWSMLNATVEGADKSHGVLNDPHIQSPKLATLIRRLNQRLSKWLPGPSEWICITKGQGRQLTSEVNWKLDRKSDQFQEYLRRSSSVRTTNLDPQIMAAKTSARRSRS